MHLSRKQWVLALWSASYVTAFAAYFTMVRNYEFLWYVAVMLFFFALIFLTIRFTHFSIGLLWGLSLWGLLHMAGGGIRVGSEVLYALPLIPFHLDGEFTILKYDQVIHAFGFGVATIALYQLFKPRWGNGPGLLAVSAALGAMGLGALNEVVEFTAVLVMSETGVGGYVNTGLDLVFNTIGAVSVALVLYVRDKRRAEPDV
jgi:hypothetical protein